MYIQFVKIINHSCLLSHEDSMAAKTHSFSTSSSRDTSFVENLKLSERRKGRANWSWIIIQALKEYAQRIEENENGSQNQTTDSSAS